MPSRALELIGALGLLAAALASVAEPTRRARLRALAYVAGAAAMAFALPSAWTALQLSPYKGLSQALRVPGAVVEVERSSPLGLLSAVRSPEIPFRHAPGLSLNNLIEPAAQIGVFTDGESLSPITAFDGRPRAARLSRFHHGRAALPPPGCGRRSWCSAPAPARTCCSRSTMAQRRIDAVELNPQLVELVRGRYAEFAGNLYGRPEVRVHIGEARGFVAAAADRYDLIQVPLLDAFAAAAAGTLSLNESFVYTVEAFETYLDHLAEGRLPRDHALAEAAAARCRETVPHGAARARAPGRRRAGPSARPDPQLGNHDAPGQERPAHARGHRAHPQPSRTSARSISPTIPGMQGGRGQPLQSAAGAVLLRSRAAADRGPRRLPRAVQVRPDTRDRRPAVLLRFLQVAGAAGALGGLGAVGRRAARLGLSDPGRDARCRRRS